MDTLFFVGMLLAIFVVLFIQSFRYYFFKNNHKRKITAKVESLKGELLNIEKMDKWDAKHTFKGSIINPPLIYKFEYKRQDKSWKGLVFFPLIGEAKWKVELEIGRFE